MSDCTECGAGTGQRHAPYCAYNDDDVDTLRQYWCYRCSYDFEGYVEQDGSDPACPRCGLTDQVEEDTERN